LPFKLNRDRRRHIPKQKRKVTNSAAYDASLRQRGSLTVWFTDEAIEGWRVPARTTPGGQRWYSPLAILTALTLRAVFHLALRQTEGLIGPSSACSGSLWPSRTTPRLAAGRKRWRCHGRVVTPAPCICWWTARA